MTTPARANEKVTDADIIHAITQTMIGEFLTKYTRRRFTCGEKKERKFVWIHPYTKTIYWSDQDPSGASSSGSNTKSGKWLTLINGGQ